MNLTTLETTETRPNIEAASIAQPETIPLWMPLTLGILAYAFLQVNFNIYIEDDSWSLSNAWNYTKLGVAKDLVFVEPDAPGFNQYFGLTYSLLMGQLLNILGWTKSSAFLVNSILIWLTALVWWKTLQALPFSKTIADLTMVFLPIFPPFFFAAHVGRPDALMIFIFSLQMLLFIRQRYFLAAFLTGVAFEIHIMGVVGLFFLLAFALYKREELLLNKAHFQKLFIQFFLGGVAALAYYWMWHYDNFSFSEITTLISEKRDMSCPVDNYLFTFFIDFDWYAHLWELVLFIAVSILYFKKGIYRKNQFLTILLIVLVISTFLTRRENRNYFAYVFPAFLFMYFYYFEQIGRLRVFTIALTLVLTLYYSLHYYHHNYYDFERIMSEVNQNLEDESMAVIGIPDFWFATQEKKFIPIHSSRRLERVDLDSFYFIQSRYLEYRIRDYTYVENYYLSNYETAEISEVEIEGKENIKILKCIKPQKEIPPIEYQWYPGWWEVTKKYLNDTVFS